MIASDLLERGELEHLLEEVRHAVERPMMIDGQTMVVTASLGMAIYPDDAGDTEKLMWMADQRMYLLKPRRASYARSWAEAKPGLPAGVSTPAPVKDGGSLVSTESSRRRLRTALADEASSL